MKNLIQSIDQYSKTHNRNSRRLAIHLDNSKEWLAIDQIATKLEWIIVPIPHFFSLQQILHVIEQVGVSSVICQSSVLPIYLKQGFIKQEKLSNDIYLLVKSVVTPRKLPHGTHKITFTSGTTAEPKGVCLSYSHLSQVGSSLAQATKKFKLTRHISVLPYSVLLENMAAVYANNFAQLEIISPSLAEVGLTGSGGFDVETMVNTVVKHRADSFILMPQMLKQLIAHQVAYKTDLSFIKFIAVGGAVCSEQLITQSHQLGLPVYQGYGISECGSVISLNTNQDAPGTVGQSLNHCQISISSDKEILVSGPLFLGYLGDESNDSELRNNTAQSIFKTGDIGSLDDHGALIITGRKKNIIINSFGRNILPDWIEGELQAIQGIIQAVVYGDNKPFLSALIVSQLDEKQLQSVISNLNKKLPDYAQIVDFLKVEPFTIENGMLSTAGKTKTNQIFKHYRIQLESLYASNTQAKINAI